MFVKIVKFCGSTGCAWLCAAVNTGVIGIFSKILLPVMLHLKADDCLAM